MSVYLYAHPCFHHQVQCTDSFPPIPGGQDLPLRQEGWAVGRQLQWRCAKDGDRLADERKRSYTYNLAGRTSRTMDMTMVGEKARSEILET